MKTELKIPIDEIPDAVVLCDFTGAIQEINSALEALFGYSPEELKGQKIELLVPGRFSGHAQMREAYMKSPVSRPMGSVQRIFGQRKDGTEVPLDISLKRLGDSERFLCFARDTSEHYRLTEEVRKTAYYDPVTGVLNRRAFNEDLAGAIFDSDQLCLGLFDFDHFKDVNDTLGHSVGDKLLLAFCERMREMMSPGMKLYRVGGDEFALIISKCANQQNALAFIETAIWNVRKPLVIDGHEISIGCSAGIVEAPQDGSTPDELLSNADLALYHAKLVRGRASGYTPELRSAAEERFKLLSDLQTAIQDEQFELHFQPQIETETGKILGAEALLRWRHPERGLLAPNHFIDLLAESEMSIQVGRWILRQACREACKWQRFSSRKVKVAVNLFPRQTYSKSLVTDVTHALSDSGLDPSCLELELTENTIMDSANDVMEVLRYFRDLGITIGLDDFGTGYASLKSLTSYPLDTIKVDRSFVFDIARRKENQAVLCAVIMLARQFGLTSVAEGVETNEDAEIMQYLGFDLGQGYYWSKPVPADQLEQLLRGKPLQHRKPAATGSVSGHAAPSHAAPSHAAKA